ncbi:MAG TPA: type II toxin-antitoxin system PemK/MazF family toxin [Streptosporangiaceae bacterium]|nr:type II toxin-antitoxin system PemK/MazF family toxin [Streptosporangiaceae bacterium]
MSEPLRPGDVWLADLTPVAGSGQAGRHPVIVVSGPLHLALPHGVAFVVPVTSRDRRLRHQIPITSISSGLERLPAFARPEDARAVSGPRLTQRLGAVAPAELTAIRRILAAFLDLSG